MQNKIHELKRELVAARQGSGQVSPNQSVSSIKNGSSLFKSMKAETTASSISELSLQIS